LTVQARVTVISRDGSKSVSLDEFLTGAELPQGEIILTIHVPLSGENTQFNSYKAALRAVNSHAFVNAGFQVTIENQTFQQTSIVYGGVLPHDVPGSRPVVAKQTQAFLVGKPVSHETFKAALEVLKQELQVQDSHKKAYRETLISGFFYKFFMSIIAADARIKSVSEDLFKTRPVSKAKQSFAYSNEHEPVSSAVSKLSAKSLAAGDAKFVDDLRTSKDTAFAAYIVHTRARAKVISIDTSLALQAPGNTAQ
jgi:xanthine dehydrogenase/oxidase